MEMEISCLLQRNSNRIISGILAVLLLATTVFTIPNLTVKAEEEYHKVFDYSDLISSSALPKISVKYSSSWTADKNDWADKASAGAAVGNGCVSLQSKITDKAKEQGYGIGGSQAQHVNIIYEFPINSADMNGEGISFDYRLDLSSNLFYRICTSSKIFIYEGADGNGTALSAATDLQTKTLKFENFITDSGASMTADDVKDIKAFQLCQPAPDSLTTLSVIRISLLNPTSQSGDNFVTVKDYQDFTPASEVSGFSSTVNYTWKGDAVGDWNYMATKSATAGDGCVILRTKITDQAAGWGFGWDGWQTYKPVVAFALPLSAEQLQGDGIAVEYTSSVANHMFYKLIANGTSFFIDGKGNVNNSNIPLTPASSTPTKKVLKYADFIRNDGTTKITADEIKNITGFQICFVPTATQSELSISKIEKLSTEIKETSKTIYDYSTLKAGSKTPDIGLSINSAWNVTTNDWSDQAYSEISAGDGAASMRTRISEQAKADGFGENGTKDQRVCVAYRFAVNPGVLYGSGIAFDYTLSSKLKMYYRISANNINYYCEAGNGKIGYTAAADSQTKKSLNYSDFVSANGAVVPDADLKQIKSFEICLIAPDDSVTLNIASIYVINQKATDVFNTVLDYAELTTGSKAPDILCKVNSNWNTDGNEWAGKGEASVSAGDGAVRLYGKLSDEYKGYGYGDDGWQNNRSSFSYQFSLTDGALNGEGFAFDYTLSSPMKLYYRVCANGKIFYNGVSSINVPYTPATDKTVRKSVKFSEFTAGNVAMTATDIAAIEYIQICTIAPVKATTLSISKMYVINPVPEEELKLQTVMDYSDLTAQSAAPTVKTAVGLAYSSDDNCWSGKANISVAAGNACVALAAKIDPSYEEYGYGYNGWNNEKGVVTVSCRFPTGKGNLDGTGIALDYSLDQSLHAYYRVHTKNGDGKYFYSDVTRGEGYKYTTTTLASTDIYSQKLLQYSKFADTDGSVMSADDIKNVDYFDICFVAPKDTATLKIQKIYVVNPNPKETYALDEVIDYSRMTAGNTIPSMSYIIDEKWSQHWNGRSGKADVSVKTGDGCAVMKANITQQYKDWGWGIGGYKNSPECIGFKFAINKGSYNGDGVAFDYMLDTADTNGLSMFYRLYSNGKVFYAEANGGSGSTVQKTAEYKQTMLKYSEFTWESKDANGKTVSMTAEDIKAIDTFEVCFLLPDPNKPATLSIQKIYVVNPTLDYKAVQDFEGLTDSVPETVATAGDGIDLTVNADAEYLCSGSKSLQVTSSVASGSVVIPVNAEELCGKGFRLWVKGEDAYKVTSLSIRLKDGTIVPCLTDVTPEAGGGYLTVNFVKYDINKSITERINGVVLSFEGNASGKTVFRIDDLAVINPVVDNNEYMTLADFDSSMVAPSMFTFNNLPSEIVNDPAKVYNKNSLHISYDNYTKQDFYSSFWSSFSNKTMYGDGIRFWMKINVTGKSNHIQFSHLQIAGMSIDWVDYYNGFEGWVTIPFSSMPGYTEDKIKDNTNFAMTIWAPPETKYNIYIDSVQIINPKHTPVTGISMTNEKVEMFTGGCELLSASIMPRYAYNKALTWASDNPEVADIDANGIVNAYKKGKANITATTADGGFTASCKVVVKERDNTASRVLYDFDNGQIPGGISLNNCTNQLDYVNVLTGTSLRITPASPNSSVTFTPENAYQFYGSTLSIWLQGSPENVVVLSLITSDGTVFSQNLGNMDEDGYSYELEYGSFKNAWGASPTLDQIINSKSLTVSVSGGNGSPFYVDAVKVHQPRIFGINVFPKWDMNGTGIEVSDVNAAMGNLVCQVYDGVGESDTKWAMKLLKSNGINEDNYSVKLYQINFLDQNYSLQDLNNSVKVTLPNNDSFDAPYLWILHFNNDGTFDGVKLIKSGQGLDFMIKKSGLYAVILRYAGLDEDSYDDENQDVDYDTEYADDIDTLADDGNVNMDGSVTKISGKKYKTAPRTITYNYFPTWALVLCIVGGAVVVGGGTFVIVARVRRKKKIAAKALPEGKE